MQMKGRQELAVSQTTKQIQRLILSPQMQQALHLLQLPILELTTVIEEELAHNPLLEADDRHEECELLRKAEEEMRQPSCQGQREEEDLKAFIENTVAYESSLFHHLIQQAQETFENPEKRSLAEWVIGNLDPDGLLTSSLEDLALFSNATLEEVEEVLAAIQTFEPLGVGARNLQEALMIQLRGKGKEQTLAFRIVERHYDDLIHNRIPFIAKSLSRSPEEIKQTILDEISLLDLHPGTNQPHGHYRQVIQPIIPDVLIHQQNGRLSIEINDERIPHLRLNHHYLRMLENSQLSEETRAYIQEKIASGKWLLRNLHERHHTLYRIAEELMKTQRDFLTRPDGKLIPATMREVAEKLELHESTIARAVANKYVSCPRGIFSLRSFFSHAYVTEEGENISARTVKELLVKLIKEENPKKPLSDETLSSLIKSKGIPCARRTVAKYRQELGIGNTSQRKVH